MITLKSFEKKLKLFLADVGEDVEILDTQGKICTRKEYFDRLQSDFVMASIEGQSKKKAEALAYRLQVKKNHFPFVYLGMTSMYFEKDIVRELEPNYISFFGEGIWLLLYIIPEPDRKRMTTALWHALQKQMMKIYRHPFYNANVCLAPNIAFPYFSVINLHEYCRCGNRLDLKSKNKLTEKKIKAPDFYPGKGCKTLDELLNFFEVTEDKVNEYREFEADFN